MTNLKDMISTIRDLAPVAVVGVTTLYRLSKIQKELNAELAKAVPFDVFAIGATIDRRRAMMHERIVEIRTAVIEEAGAADDKYIGIMTQSWDEMAAVKVSDQFQQMVDAIFHPEAHTFTITTRELETAPDLH